MKSEKRNVLAKLKMWLLKGRKITALQALTMWNTMRLAEYIRELRHEHDMKIEMEWVQKGNKRFGEYFIPKSVKPENRITNHKWREQAEYKRLKVA
jgi:hypothetical protein